MMEHLVINWIITAEAEAHTMWESEGILKLSIEIIIIIIIITILQSNRGAGRTAGTDSFILSRKQKPRGDIRLVYGCSSQ